MRLIAVQDMPWYKRLKHKWVLFLHFRLKIHRYIPRRWTNRRMAAIDDACNEQSVTIYTERHSCFWCGSDKEPYYSRIAPMGYVCPDCGRGPDHSENAKAWQEGRQGSTDNTGNDQ